VLLIRQRIAPAHSRRERDLGCRGLQVEHDIGAIAIAIAQADPVVFVKSEGCTAHGV
jgi:hypothetical protein